MNRSRKALFVGITSLLVMGGMVGVMSNCNGILFAAIIQDRGFRAGDLSMYYTIKSIATALSLTFTVKLALKKNTGIVMCIYGIISCAAYMAMACFNDLWQWYIAAAVFGVTMGCVFTIIPIILNNWFRTNNGMVIGLVMAGSGIFGTIYSPIMSALILNFGWRQTSVITGLFAGVIVCIPSILFLRVAPEGMENAQKASGRKSAAEGTGKSAAVPAWVFPLCVLLVLFPSLQINFTNQITVFSMSIGYSLAVGGIMTSCVSIGNVAGKFILGFLADRIGIFKSIIGTLFLVLAAGVLYLFAPAGVPIAYAASLLFGLVYSMYSTGPSLLLLQIYGIENYAEKYSRIQAINTFIYAFGSPAVAYIYDLTGSFTPAFIIFILMNIMSIGFVLVLARRKATE